MRYHGLCVWGDSIAKGVIFDEERGRYTICRDNCLLKLSRSGECQVNNYSVMGQTSENGLERMNADALKPGEIAAIEYGGNDCDLDWQAVSDHPSVRQYGKVPLERFGQNIEEMVQRARTADMDPVLVTPPPLIAKRYFDWVSHDRNRENILSYLGDVEEIYRWQEGYANRVRALAEKLHVTLVDIRSRLLEGNRLGELMCIDGIHPNAAGHALIYETVAPLLV